MTSRPVAFVWAEPGSGNGNSLDDDRSEGGGVELGGLGRSGVITSIAFGTVAGSTEQIGLVPPGTHTPNWNGWGRANGWMPGSGIGA